MKDHPLICLLLSVFLLALCAGCSTPRVSPNLRFGPIYLDGDVGVGANNVARVGSSVKSLGLDDNDDDLRFEPRVDLD